MDETYEIYKRRLSRWIDSIVSHFMDVYQCYDWRNMSAVELACDISDIIKEQLLIYAEELDNPDDE